MTNTSTNNNGDPSVPGGEFQRQSPLSEAWQTITDLVNAYDSVVPELQLQELEARVLYDASPLIAVAGESIEQCAELELDEIYELCFDDASSADHSLVDANSCEECLTIDANAFEDSSVPVDMVSRQLVVIDERIEGFETLVADITGNESAATAYDVLVVGRDENGFELVSDYLNGLTSYGAIHLVGHGNDNQIQLGSENLSTDTFARYESELQNWNQGLEADADILLYGCEVASSEQGQELVDQISAITGADVAASDDLTGNADLGGDWEFEYTVGLVQTDVVFTSQIQADYQGVFATFEVDTLADVVDAGDGLTSLREAIIAVNDGAGGDTIMLGAGTHALSSMSGTGDEARGPRHK